MTSLRSAPVNRTKPNGDRCILLRFGSSTPHEASLGRLREVDRICQSALEVAPGQRRTLVERETLSRASVRQVSGLFYRGLAPHIHDHGDGLGLSNKLWFLPPVHFEPMRLQVGEVGKENRENSWLRHLEEENSLSVKPMRR